MTITPVQSHSAGPIISAPVAKPVDGVLTSLKSLQPPSRGFVTKLFDRLLGRSPGLHAEKIALARMTHSDMRYKAAMANPASELPAMARDITQNLHAELVKLGTANVHDPARLVRAVQLHAGQKLDDVRSALVGLDPENFVSALSAALQKAGGLSAGKAQVLAATIHTALVAQVATHDAETSKNREASFRQSLTELANPSVRITDHLDKFEATEKQLAEDKHLSGNARANFIQEFKNLREGMEQNLDRALKAGIKEINEADISISARLDRFDALKARFVDDARLSDGLRSGIREQLSNAESSIETRHKESLAAKLTSIEGSGERVADQLDQLTAIEKSFPSDARLSEAVRTHCDTAMRALRARLEVQPDQAITEIAGHKTSVTVQTPVAELTRRMAALQDLSDAADRSTCLKPEERLHIRTSIAQTRDFLGMLERREETLRNIHNRTLAEVLTNLDANQYCVAAHGMEDVLSAVKDAGPSDVYERLGKLITHSSQARWLGDIHAKDPEIIDMIFKGAEWNNDAYAMKRAAIDQRHQEVCSSAEQRHGKAGVTPDAASLQTALDNADARQRFELRNLDVQHSLRLASQQLDETMRALAAQDPKLARILPHGAFSALKADAKLIIWLKNNAPAAVQGLDLMIANWISLSLHDPAKGELDGARAKELFNLLLREKLDVDQIKQYVRQGFSSTASIVACQEQISNFAKEFTRASGLIKGVSAALAPTAEAERVGGGIFHKITGLSAELGDGPEASAAIQRRFDQVLGWTKNEALLVGLREKRDSLISQLSKAPDGLPPAKDRDWLSNPKEDKARTKALNLVSDVLQQDREAQRLDLTPDARKASEKQRDALLKQLAGFSPSELKPTKSKTVPSLAQLRLIEPQLGMLRDLFQTHRNESNLKVLVERGRAEQSGFGDFITQVRHLAIFREAVASQDAEFTPANHTGAILNRMKAFGFDPGSASPTIQGALRNAAEKLRADERPVGELCKAYDPEPAKAQIISRIKGGGPDKSQRADIAARASAGEAGGGAPKISDAEKQRRAIHTNIDHSLKAMQAGQSFSISFGTMGTVEVSAPFVPFASATVNLSVKRDNSLRISLDDSGTYTIEIRAGDQVRKGVSLATFADLLTLGAGVSADRASGQRFRIADQDLCRKLVAGLATGEASNPELWAKATVERVAQSGKAIDASANLTLDATIVALTGELAASAGVSREVSRSASGETEMISARIAASAKAGISVAAGALEAEKVAGIDLAVHKALDKQFGMLSATSHVTMVATVVGNNADSCLTRLLPAGLPKGEVDALRAQVKNLEDGSELFLRATIKKDVSRRVNSLLAEATAERDRANLSRDPAVKQGAKAAQQRLTREAYALTAQAESYVVEGIGWTNKTIVEKSRGMGIYQQYASGERQESQFVAFQRGGLHPAHPIP